MASSGPQLPLLQRLRSRTCPWHARSPREWVLGVNDPASHTGVRIAYALLPGDAPGQEILARVSVASFVHDHNGGEAARCATEKLRSPAPPAELAEGGLPDLDLRAGSLRAGEASGSLGQGADAVEWALRWTPLLEPGPMPLSPLGGFAGLGLRLDAPRATFSGSLRLGQRLLDLDGALGFEAQRWWGLDGRPRAGAWLCCPSFDGAPGACLAVASARIPLLGGDLWSPGRAQLRWDGRGFAFEGLTLAHRRRLSPTARGFHLELFHPRLRVRGTVESPPAERVLDRVPCHRAQAFRQLGATARVELIIEEPSRFHRRWVEAARLHSEAAAHWELCSPREPRSVRRSILP